MLPNHSPKLYIQLPMSHCLYSRRALDSYLIGLPSSAKMLSLAWKTELFAKAGDNRKCYNQSGAKEFLYVPAKSL